MQRKVPRAPDDEAALHAESFALAELCGRYSYRRVAALLRDAGWRVNARRVKRTWRHGGPKVPPRQPKRSHLWLNDSGSWPSSLQKVRHHCRMLSWVTVMPGLVRISSTSRKPRLKT